MDRKKLLIRIVILMLAIFALNWLAGKLYWYSLITGFDKFMHFLSGFWVGIFFVYVSLRKNPLYKPLSNIILYVLLIGVAWEVFEFFVNNVIGPTPFDAFDTSTDILFDFFGGVAAYLYMRAKTMPTRIIRVQ